MAHGRSRREPPLAAPAHDSKAGAFDIRVSPEDRPGGVMARKAARPTKSAPPPRTPRSAKPRSGPRRSILGRLVYASMVLGLWAVIGVAGLVAYHAAQLPPIDQIAVPKRPPNIAILASDGSLIANRGETGGRTDRKGVAEGKRGDLGGRRIIKKK